MKKVFAIILLLSMLGALCACTVGSPEYAAYGKYAVTENMYKYLLAYYKSSFYSFFSGYGLFDNEEYDENIWSESAEENGQTLAEQVADYVDNQINEMLVSAKLYEKYENNDTKTLLEKTVNEFVDQYISAVGSRAELNSILGQYDMNINTLRRVFELEAKALIVDDKLFGDNGEYAVTDAEREAYYQANFSRVKHILIKNDVKYVLDDKGQPKMDIYTGKYVTEELTEDEKAEKLATANEILEKAKNGESFEDLITEYNEDGGMATYKDGYFVTADTMLDTKYITAALTLGEGEVTLAETSYGLIIMKKYPLEEGLWKNDINAAFFEDVDGDIKSEKKKDVYGKYYGEITRYGADAKALFPTVYPLDSRLIATSDE